MTLNFKNSFTAFLVVGAIVTTMHCSAIAADLGQREPTYGVPSETFRYLPWSGAYVGGHIGGGWGSLKGSYGGSDLNFGLGGVEGGGHIGYNFRLSEVVLGVEGDFDASSIKWSTSGALAGLGSGSVSVGPNWLASVRGRVGFPLSNKVMLYGTGGIAWSDLEGKLSVSGATASADKTMVGYVAGGGVELRLNSMFTSRVEALHYGFDDTVTIVGTPIKLTNEVTTIRAGLSYYFQ